MTDDVGQVVFAGGGCRCFWQAGFWEAVSGPLKWAPSRVGCVSAGAAMACMLFSGTTETTLAYFKKITSENRRNVFPRNLFRDRPVFPHHAMYRAAIQNAVSGEAWKRLHAGPEIRILLAVPPRSLGPRVATLLGFLCYMMEKRLRHPVHPGLAQRVGFKSRLVPVSTCRHPEDLIRLILASSCTPPLIPIMSWNGLTVLDGGLVDNVPVHAVAGGRGKTLVLLTRHYPPGTIPRDSDRIYVQPSEPVPVSKWDYKNPEGIQATFDLGNSDGRRFLENQ